MPFCARKGFSLIEVDYTAQELRAAGALSKDKTMTESFTAPLTIKGPDGEDYPNPVADLHTLSAQSISQDWFKGCPTHLLVKRAREVPPGATRSPRDDGKTLNFAKVYLSSPQSIAERNHITLELAKMWDQKHKETYSGYYDWAHEVGRIAISRGFAINSRGRIRWVDEANSKGAGESPERSAVNFMVQGLCADLTKEADIRCSKELNKEGVQCLLAVHDALLFEVPGSTEVDWENSKCVDGVYTKLKYKVDKGAKQIADCIVKIMEDVETEFFKDLGSPIKGAAEAGVFPYWSH